MNIEKIEIDVANQGHITNTYLVYNSKNEKREGIIIDPADNFNYIVSIINDKKVDVKYIVITHAHGDHIGALEDLRDYTKAKIIIHANDKEAILNNKENYCDMLNVKKQNILESDLLIVNDKHTISVQDMEFEIIHTPGHTSGSICIFEKSSKVLFTGDTLFCDCYGRCDLESGNFEDMVKSLRKILTRFNDIMIYPGHDKSVNIESSKRRIRLLLAMKGEDL